jgi:peptidoglycan/xylan/chitin deacetylase (PgdA/CDA1 family)
LPEAEPGKAHGEQTEAGPPDPAHPEQAGEGGSSPPPAPSGESGGAAGPTAVTHYMTDSYRFRPIEPDGNDKVVLLTFDDGPKDEEMVRTMLSVLEKHEARAIFFVNGYRVKAKPELLVSIYEKGHAIGNHSWDHILLTKESEEEVHRQIEQVQLIVEELTGERPRFFRPPNGAGNDIVRQKAKDEGMLYMTWSNGSRDWEKGYQTPESVVEQVLGQLHPGSNILMHELPWTVEALDTLLTELENAGYVFLDPRSIRIDAE